MPINRLLSPTEDTVVSVDGIVQRLIPKIHREEDEYSFFEYLMRRADKLPINLCVVEGIPRETLLDPNEHVLSKNLPGIFYYDLKHPEKFEIRENAQYMVVPFEGKEVLAVTPLYSVEIRATFFLLGTHFVDGNGSLRHNQSHYTLLPATTNRGRTIVTGNSNIAGDTFAYPAGISPSDIALAHTDIQKAIYMKPWLEYFPSEPFNIDIELDKKRKGNVLIGYYAHTGNLQNALLPNKYWPFRPSFSFIV